LESTQDFEAEFNSFQQRLGFIDKFYQNDPQYVTKINSIVNSTPEGLVYQTLSLKKDEDNNVSASASLIAFNESSIITFINNLTLNPDIQSININQIEKKQQENNYLISVSVVFKNSKS
jgi:hypothetical protein